MNHKRLISLTICFILSIVPGLSVLSFAENDSETNIEAEQHFEKAYELRKAADYDAAIVEYEKVINLSPNSKIAQNAQYWIGQSYFESKQFDAASSAFQGFLDKYPASSIAPTTKQMIERVQQAQKNKSLFEAVKKADVEQIKLLIAQGADVDAKWEDVYNKGEEIADLHTYWHTRGTVLWYAAHVGNIAVVTLLVEAGADVNRGWPALCAAVQDDNTAIAEYLIDHGANVNYPQAWGPLQEAATFKRHNIEMVKLLIERGADVNATPWPALHTAISRAKSRDMAEFLIQHGADVNAKDTDGHTPLYYAIRHIDDSDFINLLIANGAKVDTKCTGGETALMSGAVIGRTEAVKLLLEAGADINAKDDRGQTALHRIMDISYRPSKDMAELLLDKGADVNLKDKDGRTPLHLAAESADADIVKLLLDKGARVNEKDDESGFTALHHAAWLGNTNAAEVLIARGADINSKDKQDHIPLQVAVNHDSKVAELLINKGADSSIRTESGKTLLQLAHERKEIESTVPDVIFDGEPNSVFGAQIACGDVDGDGYDDILIKGTTYDNKRSRVYLYYGGPDMDTTADLIFEGQNEGDKFGDSIAFGDIDNDGREDIVIGACGYSERRGRAYLYWGSDRDSMDANPDKIFVGDEATDAQFGAGYPTVYDIDKDGYGDIILGAYISDDRTGRAYLYYGNKKELMDTTADLIFYGENRYDLFGYAISCGDVNHDGFGDIVIGCLHSQGRAYLYYGGSKSNMDAKADVIFDVKHEGNDYYYFGRIACFDQNRDGYDDVVIGAPGYNDRQGRAYLFQGSSQRSMDANPDMILDGEFKGSYYGDKEVCGDIDGDNVIDLVIAALYFRQGSGRVYIYWGSDLSAPNPKPGRILTENSSYYFGSKLACGDINKDGFDDLVVVGYSTKAKQGRAYLYYGGPKNK